MRRRLPRAPSAPELDLWAHAMRDVQPLGGRVDAVAIAPLGPPAQAVAPPPSPSQADTASDAGRTPGPLQPQRLDRQARLRLQRGQVMISARLDLHGLDQQQAHAALHSFLALEQDRGARCVLVITGYGFRSSGVLRELTPRWLETPIFASRVLAYGPAQPRHGGAGALYVMLRRKR